MQAARFRPRLPGALRHGRKRLFIAAEEGEPKGMGLFSSKKRADTAFPGKEGRSSAETSLIGPRLSIQGKISGSGSLIVMGGLEGEIDLSGELVVSPPARLRGEIRARRIAVAGTVEGKVSAQEKIHLEKSAVFSGELKAGRLSVAEGAVLNGSVAMNRESVPPES